MVFAVQGTRPVSELTPIASEPLNVTLPLFVCKQEPSVSNPCCTLMLPILSVRFSKPLKFCTDISPVDATLALIVNGIVGLLFTAESGKTIVMSTESLAPASKPPLVSGTVAFTVRILGSLPAFTFTEIRPNSLFASLLLLA